MVGGLEASDCYSVDIVLSFLGAIVDACFGNSESAPMTKVFSLYVDIFMLMYRRVRGPGW